jgi:hypothetical protein
MQFKGSFEDLKALITLLHLQGHWVDGGEFHTFSTDQGEHINFWPDTGLLEVQGHPEESRRLEARLGEMLAGFQG